MSRPFRRRETNAGRLAAGDVQSATSMEASALAILGKGITYLVPQSRTANTTTRNSDVRQRAVTEEKKVGCGVIPGSHDRV